MRKTLKSIIKLQCDTMALSFKSDDVTTNDTNDFAKCIQCNACHAVCAELANASFETTEWADRVAAACIERYSALPRAGKPGAAEWTPLAGIVAFIPEARAGQQLIACDGIAERDEPSRCLKTQDNIECVRSKIEDNVLSGSSVLSSAGVPYSLRDEAPALDGVPSINTRLMNAEENLPTNNLMPILGAIPISLQPLPSAIHASATSLVGMDSTVRRVNTQEISMTQPPSQTFSETAMLLPAEGRSLPQTDVCPTPQAVLTPPMAASPPVPRGVVTCVALASGSKCLGGGELRAGGELVHDSHAEVLARRAFLRYLCHHAQRALSKGDSDVLEAGSRGRCRIRPGVSFHLFVTEPPCGDAAIFPSQEHARSSKRCWDGDGVEEESQPKRVYQETTEATERETVHENSNRDVAQSSTQETVPASAQEIASRHATAEATAEKNVQKYTDHDFVQASSHKILQHSVHGIVQTSKQDFARETSGILQECMSGCLEKNTLGSLELTSQAERRACTKEIAQTSIDILPDSKDIEQTLLQTLAQDTVQYSTLPAPQKIAPPSIESFALENTQLGTCADLQEIAQLSNQTSTHEVKHTSIPTLAQEITSSSGRTALQDVMLDSTHAVPKGIAQTRIETAAEGIARDVHRTGAKCVRGGAQDERAPGAGYHVTGAVRTKPGRGDPTLSLSCSDKMARWHAVGMQGALLSLLVAPRVRFRSVAIAGGVAWSSTALRRAVAERAGQYRAPLAVARSTLRSPAAREGRQTDRPCAAGLLWSCVPHRPHEVVARGRKQGVTKKAANSTAGRLTICRKELAREFVRVFSAFACRLSVPRPDPVCLYDQTPGPNDEGLGLDAEDLPLDSTKSGLDPNERDLRSMDIQAPQMGVGEERNSSLVIEESDNINPEDKQSPGRHALDDKQPDLQGEKNEARRIKEDVNPANDSNRKCVAVKMCLGAGDLVNSSSATLRSLHKSVPIVKESKCNREYVAYRSQPENNAVGSVAGGDLGKMTYAQLKAMAWDYQQDWHRVRETYFPAWPTKPSGLQDFVVTDNCESS